MHLKEGAWTANTGNGYFGGFQFAAQTWKRVGGKRDDAFAYPGDRAHPFTASAQEQPTARGSSGSATAARGARGARSAPPAPAGPEPSSKGSSPGHRCAIYKVSTSHGGAATPELRGGTTRVGHRRPLDRSRRSRRLRRIRGSASAQSTGVGFTLLPKHVVQGEDARVAVSVRPSGTRCTLNVRYQGGTQQPGLGAAIATGGRAAWTWHVPTDVQAGPARTTVRCAGAGSATHALLIVGRLVEPKITVPKQGFSTRANLGGGTRLSSASSSTTTRRSGRDERLRADELRDGRQQPARHRHAAHHRHPRRLRLRARTHGQLPRYRADHAARGRDPGREVPPRALHNPTLANIHLVPGLFDPSWLGTIEGELQNTDLSLSLQSADLSAVVFDTAGNMLGGGSGFAFQTLPPGAREFIQLNYGLDAIPMDNAASIMISGLDLEAARNVRNRCCMRPARFELATSASAGQRSIP